MFGCTTSQHHGYTLKTEKPTDDMVFACSLAQHPKTAKKLSQFIDHAGLRIKAAKTDASEVSLWKHCKSGRPMEPLETVWCEHKV